MRNVCVCANTSIKAFKPQAKTSPNGPDAMSVGGVSGILASFFLIKRLIKN
jgi:hypothetical protein